MSNVQTQFKGFIQDQKNIGLGGRLQIVQLPYYSIKFVIPYSFA